MSTTHTRRQVAPDDLGVLLPDWSRHLRAMNRAPSTIASYGSVGTHFLAYLSAKGMPTAVGSIRREHVEAYIADMVDVVSAATVAKHYRSLQQLWRWLVDDGEIPDSPMARMRPPKVPEQPVPVLTEDDLSALLAVCKGNTFENRRDTALIRMLADTGMRAGELVGLALEDLNHEHDVAVVMGKGRRRRSVPYGAKTADALRRYLRARARHPQARLGAVWLGRKGALSDSGLRQLLERRGNDAGVPGLHPHLFRHSFAHQWLANGGQEVDLMRIAGWQSREMVARYGASAAVERAHAAHRRMALGDRV